MPMNILFQERSRRDIVDCLNFGSSTTLYGENVRKFALTVHFYSPRGYNYIREKFSNNLPHVSTIRKWYQNSSTNGEAGFCKQSFSTLAELAAQQKANGIELVCALNFDEMSIRKHLQWSDSRKKFIGHTNYGFRPECEELPLANNVIVFMLHGVNVKFSIPIAFYLIETLKSEEKVELLKEILGAVAACGARVLSITFDGLSSNLAMCELLGANFNLNDFKPHFVLPNHERKIYILLDPSHMLKLARNCVANNAYLIDENNSRIKWKYFETLEHFRVNKGFTLTHKLNKKHIQFKNFKMNVRVAAETLSNSVANSMNYLMNCGHKEFAKSTPTIRFIQFVNNVFDVMNTSATNRTKENLFKNPISPQNEKEIFAYFEKAIEFFKKLKLPNGTLLVESRTRTAFRGFIANMINLRCIYEEYVETNLMSNLPTQMFSQDHLEAFFGRIRSLNGRNENPTAEQFSSAFRKIVVNNDIRSTNGNCHDSLDILSVSSARQKVITAVVNESTIAKYEGVSNKRDKINNVPGELEDASIAHTALLIERKMEDQCRFNCELCLEFFSQKASMRIGQSSPSDLTSMPCQSVHDICSLAHKYVDILTKDASYTYDQLLADVMREFDIDLAFNGASFEGHESHKYYCIQYVAEEYIRVHATYVAKKATLNEHKILIGARYKKMAHFLGQ